MVNKINKENLAYLFFAIIVLFIFTATYGCKDYVYSFKTFSYPPSSKPHEDDWKYYGKIIVASKEKGPLNKKSEKYIHIIITDRTKKVYLSDKMKFVCGDIDFSVFWNHFEEVEITLYEVGDRVGGDTYDRKLTEKGLTLISNLIYTYDGVSEKFERRRGNILE